MAPRQSPEAGNSASRASRASGRRLVQSQRMTRWVSPRRLMASVLRDLAESSTASRQPLGQTIVARAHLERPAVGDRAPWRPAWES